MHYLQLMHTHPFSVTLADKPPPTHTHSHPRSNFPRVSAASSLQCDCAASLVTLRIIEYRSPASAAVCKRVFLRTSVRLTGALQGHCHGNVKTGAFHRAATEHRSQGSHQEGDERGLASTAVPVCWKSAAATATGIHLFDFIQTGAKEDGQVQCKKKTCLHGFRGHCILQEFTQTYELQDNVFFKHILLHFQILAKDNSYIKIDNFRNKLHDLDTIRLEPKKYLPNVRGKY